MTDVPNAFEVEFTGEEGPEEIKDKLFAQLIGDLSKSVSSEAIDAIKLGRIVMALREELRESGHGRGIQFLGSHGENADRIADKVLAGLITNIYSMAEVPL